MIGKYSGTTTDERRRSETLSPLTEVGLGDEVVAESEVEAVGAIVDDIGSGSAWVLVVVSAEAEGVSAVGGKEGVSLSNTCPFREIDERSIASAISCIVLCAVRERLIDATTLYGGG